jgi:signal peptidase I
MLGNRTLSLQPKEREKYVEGDGVKRFLKSVLEWIIIIAVAFLLSLVIRTFVIDTRIVPTGSMLPTIQLDDRLIVDRLFYKFDTIKRGDIIVFRATREMVAEDEDLVKRAIGLPGEKVQIKNGKVFINDRELNEPYIAEPPVYDYGPVTVPAGSYFMLGDNRNDSKDSHIWGFLDSKLILGRVWVRYWPLDRFGSIGNVPENYLADNKDTEKKTE